MTQNDLDRAVARATGESVSCVKHLGFLMDEPPVDAEDPGSSELGPEIIDWDQLDAERSSRNFGRPCREPIPA